MSWKKEIKGGFGEVREQVDGLTESVRRAQGKITSPSHEKLVNAHTLQARIAQLAIGEITARHSEEQSFSLSVGGEVEPDGSGSVTIEYSFARAKAKAATRARASTKGK